MRERVYIKILFLLVLSNLLSITYLWAQTDFSVKVLKDYAYVIRVDPAQNKLVRSADPELLPWLPKDKFGWWIPDQNYFDLFFQHQDFSQEPPHINFYQYIVLAVLKYDYQPWDLSLESVNLKEKGRTLALQYRAKVQGQPKAQKQVSVMIILVERNKKLEKIGVRNLNYAAFEYNDQCRSNPCEVQQAEVFPRAHSAERYLTAENPKPLVQYVLGRQDEIIASEEAVKEALAEEVVERDVRKALAVAEQTLGQAQEAEQAAARQQAIWTRNRLLAERKKRTLKREEDSLKRELVLNNRKREQLRQRLDSLGQYQKHLESVQTGTRKAIHLADAEVQLAQSQEREGAKQQQLLAQARMLAADRVASLQDQLRPDGEDPAPKVYRSGPEALNKDPRAAIEFLELTGCQLKSPDAQQRQLYIIRDLASWEILIQAEDSLLRSVDFERFVALVYHQPKPEKPLTLIPSTLHLKQQELRLSFTALSLGDAPAQASCSVLLLERSQLNCTSIAVTVNGKQALSVSVAP